MLKTEKVIGEILKSPITDRDVIESKKLYKELLEETGLIRCVWTDNPLTTYDVDHMIPFSIWKNNDLWNLLPATGKINNEKRKKIPTADFLDSRKEMIFYYWELVRGKLETRFNDEIKIALLGNCIETDWQSDAFKQLKRTSNYLIETRGYEGWTL